MTEDAVLYSLQHGVATLTLNRPEAKNSMSAAMMNGLGDGLTKAIADDAVRLIVLTNEGNTFCAGANLKGGDTQAPRYHLVEIFEMMFASPKPVVGRINGHCMGGGVGLAAACDISVAASEVKLGFTEVRIGVAPAIISVVCLPKMRRGDGMELFLSGEKISAARAAEVGLINYAADDLDAKVAEIIEKLVAGGPNAIAASKQLVVRMPDLQRKDAFEWTAKLSAELFAGEQAKEGIAAFRERRPAAWVPKKAG